MHNRLPRSARAVCALSLAAVLAGCATLPASGPTGRQVERGTTDKDASVHFQIVDLNGAEIATLARVPESGTRTIASLAKEGEVDRIAPGDELGITIYEVGLTLFGGTAAFGSTGPSLEMVEQSARPKPLGIVRVAGDGTIRLPYVGRIAVAGSTPYDVQRMIEQGMQGKSQSPQALVTVISSPHNSALVVGDVMRAGRVPLSAARERLMDALAAVGGPKVASADVVVRLNRGDQSAEMRLADMRVGGADDIQLLPGDRVEIITEPRSFSVFGAARVSEVPFAAPRVSLAEALARAGGPLDAQADPRAIFIFRYDAAGFAAGKPPTVYRLNLMKPESYIIAQNIAMHDKDLIYVANAASGPVTKFIGVLNQLFAPVFTVRSLTTNP